MEKKETANSCLVEGINQLKQKKKNWSFIHIREHARMSSVMELMLYELIIANE